jgi:hypothetical protein
MANTLEQTHNDFNFTNSLKAINGMGGGSTLLGVPQNYTSITSMRAFLLGFDPLTYTDTVLNIMTTNDMVFAIRNIQDPTTISDYISAQIAQ